MLITIWLLFWLATPIPGNEVTPELIGVYVSQPACERQLEFAAIRPPADRRLGTGRYACLAASAWETSP